MMVLVVPSMFMATPLLGQSGSSYDGLMGADLYHASCANCHGVDGSGIAPNTADLETPPADFSSCTFASREPTGDWVGVAHEGGPVRGFSHVMPAFGDALTVEQLESVIDYIREFCGNDSWPRGELNMPRPMVTEKAYPEDEVVFTTGTPLEGPGSVTGVLTYEKRFGVRNQLEIIVPVGARARTGEGESGWVGGLGDVVVGMKRAMWHSSRSGSIVSLAAEMKLPTGKEADGFGSGTPVFESFLSYGQLLPLNGFLQFQGVIELPFDKEKAANEGALRAALGTTITQGNWGRAWSPMVEVLASRELESGATTHFDLVPQVQVTLNTRQHVMGNVAVRIPVNDTETRHPTLLFYILWDWFDGGFFDGW
jgi:mono/diheme cytochrome c family protein